MGKLLRQTARASQRLASCRPRQPGLPSYQAKVGEQLAYLAVGVAAQVSGVAAVAVARQERDQIIAVELIANVLAAGLLGLLPIKACF
jgi:hypothetical protein